MSPRWQHRSFLTLLPKQEEQLTFIQEQDTTERVLEYGSEAEALRCTSDQDRLYYKGREVALLLPEANTTPHEVSPEPLIPQVGKQGPAGQPAPPALWIALWEPLL